MTLEPGELGPERGGQCLGENCLADSGDVFYEEVAPAERRDGHRREGSRSSKDDVPQVLYERLAERDRLVEIDRFRAGVGWGRNYGQFRGGFGYRLDPVPADRRGKWHRADAVRFSNPR
jgi:hypothetical protein